MIVRDQWRWFGHAGHFICSRLCQFHLCTQVGEYLVSTVGEYWPERSSREIHAKVDDAAWLAKNQHLKGDDFDRAYMERFGFQEIGYARLYETMVFRAGAPCTAKGCDCGMPVPSEWSELDFADYNTPKAATEGHYKTCEKWAKGDSA